MATSDVFAKQRAAIEYLLANQDRATVVPIRDNFDDDDRLSLGIFKWPIPDNIAQAIGNVQREMARFQSGHHYNARESLHLTVQSVQTIATPKTFTDEDAHRVADMVAEVVQRFGPQRAEVQGVVKLPTSVFVSVFFDERMLQLIRELDEGLKRIGLPDNKLYVDNSMRFGNFTICRFTAPPTEEFSALLKSLRETKFGELEIDELTIASTNAVFSLHHTHEYARHKLSGES